MINKTTLPESASGAWRIEYFTITEEEASRYNLLGSMKASERGRKVAPGQYTRLMRDSTIVMTDTPAEMSDHLRFIKNATGSVLINGLGLGMVLQAVLNKPEVTEVTVIEQSTDVIHLASSHYNDPRLTIIQGDALTYKAPTNKHFDCVWHDIWDFICADNLPEMKKLHRKYGGRSNWQGSWCRGLVELYAERGASW